MKDYPSDRLRNVVLLAHGGAGKTSLAEALLFHSGAITRLGRVEEGNTVSDYDPEEIRRRISVNTSLLPIEWRDHKINLLDTPGYADFAGEMLGSTRVADAALIIVDAVGGVEVGTEQVWSYADTYQLPRLVFVNKLERENASFTRVVDQLRQAFPARFVPLQLPLGDSAPFRGLIDLSRKMAQVGPEGGEESIPSQAQEQVEAYRQAIMEAAAEADDELIMKYLEGTDLSPEEISRGLRAGIRQGKIVPILCGSAYQAVGTRQLLDAILELVPPPNYREVKAYNLRSGQEEALPAGPDAPLAALVFKTFADPYVGKLSYFRVYAGQLRSDSRVLNVRTNEEERMGQLFLLRGKEQLPTQGISAGDIGVVAKLQATSTGDTLCDKAHPLVLPSIAFPSPVFSAAITPKTKADLDKMGSALARLVEEDPTLQVQREPDTGETILRGMGESHIDIAARRLHQKFGVEIVTQPPRIPYKETIRKTASAQGRYKKQTGGRGQFGDVFLRLEPLPRGSGFEFEDEIFGGAVPKNYIPAVEKGLREAIQKGILAGYPTIDFRAALHDGSYHPVDSSEMAFKIAASLGFKKAMEQASPVLLEPIMNVTITVPENVMGDVLGDLNAKRARVMGMEQTGGKSIITAQVPLAEMQRYATDLRSITQGRGTFTMEFSHYEEVPPHLSEQIIKKAKQEAGVEEEEE
ncbi:MAG: elongation factor G [Chloroflexi bacterium]|nr:elongation factor G [Chloroflexota bacterium]